MKCIKVHEIFVFGEHEMTAIAFAMAVIFEEWAYIKNSNGKIRCNIKEQSVL